jgi:DNA-binding MarR family transcriptional regulator
VDPPDRPDPLARPIGYWLKLLDVLIESAFDRALASQQVARRHWQAMNVLARGGVADVDALSEAMRPFWTEDAITISQMVDDLLERGWIEQHADGLRLTAEGEAARSAVAEQVAVIRTRVTAGLAPEEYESTVRALAKMSDNLRRPLV